MNPFRHPSSRPTSRPADETPATTGRATSAEIRVLVAVGSEAEAEGIRAILARHGAEVVTEVRTDADEAVERLADTEPDLFVVAWDLRDACLPRRDETPAEDLPPALPHVVVGGPRDSDSILDAMRRGAMDFLPDPVTTDELGRGLDGALERLRAQRRDLGEQTDRLRRVCARLHDSRAEVTDQVDGLCNDLVEAYQDLAEHVTHLSHLTEFDTLVRQELEMEDLLRTTLEFALRVLGPTNAGIYLPDSGDDYALGAFVNYDLPAENADFLLDHLADVLAARLPDDREIRHLGDDAALSAWLGRDAEWLSERHVIAFACRHEDEDLALVIFFRDADQPFPEDAADLLAGFRRLFARQIAKVIRVHHRHGGEDLGFEPPDSDDGIVA